jgi:hypothetical protein
VWGYGTADPLEAVLAPGYFALARALLRPGELIYVSARPARADGSAPEVRLALLMVRAQDQAADRVEARSAWFKISVGPTTARRRSPAPPPARRRNRRSGAAAVARPAAGARRPPEPHRGFP